MINVLIVDDQAMVREALAALLNLEDGINVIAQAGDGEQALAVLAKAQRDGHAIDVALLDVEMPVMDGITAAARIREQFPGVRILMVTTFGKPGYVNRAITAGADGFVVKDAPAAELASAIARVMAGEHVVDPQLAVASLTRGTSPLSARETEILQAVATGAAVPDIAATLYLHPGTVRNHISAAISKTGARDRFDAIRIAREAGWM